MKPKRVPRLWCARQGLLPLEMHACPPLERAPVRFEPVDPRESCARKICADDSPLPPAMLARPSAR